MVKITLKEFKEKWNELVYKRADFISPDKSVEWLIDEFKYCIDMDVYYEQTYKTDTGNTFHVFKFTIYTQDGIKKDGIEIIERPKKTSWYLTGGRFV